MSVLITTFDPPPTAEFSQLTLPGEETPRRTLAPQGRNNNLKQFQLQHPKEIARKYYYGLGHPERATRGSS
ncbi:MAG: hypothetical protein QM768_18415 [Agriterribacter sp.]